MIEPLFDYQFRLILIGDRSVGKSSLVKYFADGTFAAVSESTIGVEFYTRLVKVEDGTRIKLQLWDTAGQERFRSITKSYYRNTVGALLVYDICNKTSFEHIPIWMNEAKKHIEPHSPAFVLVGCKMDLANISGSRAVDLEEAKAFAKLHNIPLVETSAKNGANVEEAFRAIAQQVYNRVKSGEYMIQDGWDGVKTGFGHDLNFLEAEPASSSSCC